ncbi:MAG: molybdopterin-dependent oxidoreductase [Candidatus Thiodiazotropha sp. (ex Codakia rugifera)]|nr:molybdopterin-dependent oxidoreductase [Candidatus Thiodiazotropha sp. (ex Codakia rugifera)]
MEMKFDGSFDVDLPRNEVFDILSDPRKFAPMLPTFHSMEMKDDRTALVRIKVGIGRISGTASTELTLEEADAPVRARYVGRGKVMQGAYQMISAFDLEEIPKGGTRINWMGETQLVGKILSLAGGGLRGYAEKEINRLISSLQEGLTPGAELPKAKPKHEGWLARSIRRLRHQDDEPQAAGKAPESAVPQGVETLARQPQEVQDIQKEARQRIAQTLGVNRQQKPLSRKEDNRLIRGRGLFVDDYKPGGTLHMALVRSPYAHAKILNIDTSAADALPGVVCTLIGDEISQQCQPFLQIGPEPCDAIKDYPLAVGKVRYQGDPVVAVVAESLRLAQDAVQLVEVEYETLDVIITCEQALQDEVLIHEDMGTNIDWQGVYEYGDLDKAFSEATHIVKIDKLHFHRFGSTAVEPNAVVATWDDSLGGIDYLANTIMTIPITMISMALGVSADHIRLRTHDIGGSFGNKIGNYPYMALAALASRKTGGRPVKWVETRSEHMQAGSQGSERSYFDTEVALDENGVITAIKSRHVDDCGAYPRYEPLGCVIWSQVLPAAYKLRNMRIDFSQVITNKGPAAPNRGYSRLPHMWFMERVVDICAHKLDIPADEMRLRNYIREFPYETPNGCVYDSGDFVALLNKAKDLIGWDEWQQKRAKAKQEGRLMGIGIGTTLDSGTNNFGQSVIVNPGSPFSGNAVPAMIKLDIDGSVSVAVGSFPHGQGHETVVSQVVAEELGITPEMVNVAVGFDTARNVHSGQCGTYASQFAVTGLSAVHGATEMLKKELKELAAFSLEAAEDDLEFGLGDMGPEVRVKGTDRGINFWALSNLVNANSARLPQALRSLNLNCRYTYRPPFEVPDPESKFGNLTLTYAMQTHLAVVEIDPHTGQVKILDYGIVDDCGKMINPMIVEGQLHGGAAHGLGAALLENLPYDESGNVLAGSFTDYAPITINNVPKLKLDHMESPSPFSYNGAKGMGEGGGAPLHAISSAVQDALIDKGIIVRGSHCSPNRIFEMLQQPDGDQVVTVERRA